MSIIASTAYVQQNTFPAVGAAVAGIPIDESASAMMSTLKANHAEEGLRVKDITFVLYGEESLREFKGSRCLHVDLIVARRDRREKAK